MKEFKGRVIAPGNWEGEAAVSKGGFNTLASFQSAALSGKDHAEVGDQNNKDLYGVNITGKALCLPITIGSTTGGLVIQTVCQMGISPSVYLFSEHIDSLAASVIVLARVWEKSDVISIDQLGEEFLNTDKPGDKLKVSEDGTVTIL